MLLAPDRVRWVLRLHERSYALLKWVGASLASRKLSFSVVHESTGSAEAVEEWLTRHRANVPADLRPDPAELRPFSFLFASFLATSFRLPAEPEVIRRNCCCDCCAYLSVAHRLVPRDVTPKNQGEAHRLKELCLEALAESLGRTLAAERRASVLGDKALSFELSHVSYVFELLRRTEFTSQGPGVLVLWRNVAWENGKPRKNFKLTAERVLAAQEKLSAALGAG